MMDNPELIKVSTELAKFVAKSSTQAILDKIRLTKAKGNSEETINNLEEIINSLIAEKNQLIQIAQTYDEQLITQKISEEDIAYISTNIIPLIERLLEYSDDENKAKNQQSLEMFKPLLSKEIIHILQLLGFNFKKAIGEPLTALVNSLISSQAPDNSDKGKELQILSLQREVEFYKTIQDEDACQRLLSVKGSN
ncbi:hypothetical protein [Sutcliffiella horikoshii]|uniref:hypothetical protein n=1 Tax=Sutcliffiella horikoshii TaxID=79883 RepID=UPI00384D846A